MKKGLFVVGFFLILGGLIPSVLAGNVTLRDNLVINDTYVYDTNPNTPYWDSTTLNSKNDTGGGSELQRIYVSFDTSGIPDDAVISNAELGLYAYIHGGNPAVDYCNISAHAVYEDILNYDVVTWNQQPCGIGFNNASACNLTYETIHPKPCQDYTLSGWSLWNMSEQLTLDLAVNDIFTVALYHSRSGAGGGNVGFYSSTANPNPTRIYMNVTFTSESEISACRQINVSGNYMLVNDINATKDECIEITVSDVTIDLNGYDVNGWATGYDDAIVFYGNSSSNLERITIHNGRILHFSGGAGVTGWYGSGITIYDMIIANNNNGIDLRWLSNSSHITRSAIYDTNITGSQTYGLYVGLVYGLDIEDSYLYNVNYDMYLVSLEQSFINKTIVGELPINNENCVNEIDEWWGVNHEYETCVFTTTYNGANYGVYCQDCLNNTFYNNHIYGSSKDFMLTGDSWGNRYYYNNFYAKSTVFNGLFLMDDTIDNYGCRNVGSIIDYGSNNIFEGVCADEYTGSACMSGYFCIDSENLGFVNSMCGYDNKTYCSSGCVAEGNTSYCLGATGSRGSLDSFLNVGSFVGGFVWIDMIFTPFFLLTMALIGFSGYFAQRFKESATVIFIVTITVGALAFVYLGVYPRSIGYLIGLLLIGVTGMYFQKMNIGGK